MDGDLVCNFKKCRKRLSSWAWVTSCSHIFCDDDGTREFNKSYCCPACETSLSGKFDILRIDLQPCDQSKSMLLAGHKPDTILEVCSRAMAFWTYQTHQELLYQQYVATKAKERNTNLEQFYEQVMTTSHTEINTLKTQISTLRKELEETKKRFSEVSEKFMERTRQYQKLLGLYDGLKRKAINPTQLDGDGDAPLSTPRMRAHAANFHMGLSASVDEVFRRHPSHGHPSHGHPPQAPMSSSEREFVLRPASTPVMGACEASSAFNARFNVPSGTPSALRGLHDHRPRN